MLEKFKAMDRKQKLALAAAATITVAVAVWVVAEAKSHAAMIDALDEAERTIVL